MIRANGLEFGLLEAGAGPLALCLHGFPDSAHTWRGLLPALAGAGFHAVAPFMRGYAPTALATDGAYGVTALAADAVALHEALGGEGDAVLIGHDWGAEAAYAAAASAPGRWRRLVTLGVPPAGLDPVLFGDYEQLRRFFYLFMFRDPDELAEAVVAADGMSFLDRLWADWSPGLVPGEHLDRVIAYYRAPAAPATAGPAPQPTLYLHGADDGCIAARLARRAGPFLAPSSRVVIVEGAGHFLHLEKPEEVGRLILTWVTG
jgi:pimeloyl-ACP methyl ester carboxylesterase